MKMGPEEEFEFRDSQNSWPLLFEVRKSLEGQSGYATYLTFVFSRPQWLKWFCEAGGLT